MQVKTRLKIGILATLSALSAGANAGDCAPIRLDDGGSMAHVAVRNQRSIGSCYAHTAVQMYDAWRFRHEPSSAADFEDFSSGFEIGQRFKIEGNSHLDRGSRLSTSATDINGGLVSSLLPYLLTEGTCSQKELNGLFLADVRRRSDLDVDTYASEVMRKFNRYRAEYNAGAAVIRANYSRSSSSNLASDQTRVATPAVDLYASMEMNRELDLLRADVLKRGVVELKAYNAAILSNPDLAIQYDRLRADSDTVHMFEVISVINCAESRRLAARGAYEVEEHSSYKRSRYHPEVSRAVIDAELSKGLAEAYPVAISYCSSVLGRGRAFKAKPPSDEKGCLNHASLVIGRRPDPKSPDRCQYLIRNSWGKNCRAYHSDWQCESERGSAWVDADTLGSAIYNLQVLKTISN